MVAFEPLHTQIQKIIQIMIGTVILEDPSGFPREKSNLYCIGRNDEIVWQAEKPEPTGMFNRVMLNTDGNTLSAYTITGQACEIDLVDGSLVSQSKMM